MCRTTGTGNNLLKKRTGSFTHAPDKSGAVELADTPQRASVSSVAFSTQDPRAILRRSLNRISVSINSTTEYIRKDATNRLTMASLFKTLNKFML